MYAAVYDELFRRVDAHPQLHQSAAPTAAVELSLIARYLEPDTAFVEIGAGDCRLALAVAERVGHVYAIEVSAEITAGVPQKENLDLIVTDGLSLPLPSAVAALAFSNQVFEHLHPDDARLHLQEVHRVLAPGGRYVCVTPNRLTGPHDISAYFDEVATGFHLREYTAAELADLMRSAGFARAEAWASRRGLQLRLPWLLIRAVEGLVGRLPQRARRRLGTTLPFRVALGCHVIGVKRGRA